MLKYIIMGVICCLALEANATTVLLSDYKAPKNEEFRAFNELYLTGVMEGLLTFNAKLATDGKPKLFCLPPKKGDDYAPSSGDYDAPGKGCTRC
jgi:hypothetical protein